MGFLTGLLSSMLPAALNWVVGFLSGTFSFFVNFFSLKKTQTARKSQAQTVEELSNQIKALAREGKTIPDELKNQLREESRKLVRDSYLWTID